mmetsp:Transcript_9426/g.13999  ORF Transcript_9426/g.13999 Transcript_9426/m.13999 type:complete len:261 (-) Transcript_9426:135-917(-)|eukprot:CAMPEP_0196816772 /NCGR_PEP_ID=MMETSP1362-20130617/57034_1 /TAXON_ID=163516 /ORGANISM="Leptocylindrus danicus, Strain CCMP1856" /LENGTH=260 /DNA_ID=CAMNT_0042194229 /DNA_START=41 /DNA_END=823 /DNA_ORIENTATION=-
MSLVTDNFSVVIIGTVLVVILSFILLSQQLGNTNEAKPPSKEDRQALANEIDAIFAKVDDEDDGTDDAHEDVALPEKRIEVELETKPKMNTLPGPEPVINYANEDSASEDESDTEENIAPSDAMENFRRAEELFGEEKYMLAAKRYWNTLDHLIGSSSSNSNNGEESKGMKNKTYNYMTLYQKITSCFDKHYPTVEKSRARLHMFIAKKYFAKKHYIDALKQLELVKMMTPKSISMRKLGQQIIQESGMRVVQQPPNMQK